MEMKFYQCETCGQIIAIVKKTGVPVMCCGKPMKEIIPGTTDASLEKHVPVYEVVFPPPVSFCSGYFSVTSMQTGLWSES